MHGEQHLWTAKAPPTDAVAAIAGIIALAAVLGIMVGIVVCGAMTMGRRDRKLRDKGSVREHLYHQVAREALKGMSEKDWDDLPQPWRVRVLVSICDAENDGRDAMLTAAKEEFGYLADRERLASAE